MKILFQNTIPDSMTIGGDQLILCRHILMERLESVLMRVIIWRESSQHGQVDPEGFDYYNFSIVAGHLDRVFVRKCVYITDTPNNALS